MKKLKKLWNENRVLMILGVILLACVIAILCVVLKYFVGSNSSVYGNRFDNMKTKITEKEQNLVIERFRELKTERSKYISRWKDVQNYVAITNERITTYNSVPCGAQRRNCN